MLVVRGTIAFKPPNQSRTKLWHHTNRHHTNQSRLNRIKEGFGSLCVHERNETKEHFHRVAQIPNSIKKKKINHKRNQRGENTS